MGESGRQRGGGLCVYMNNAWCSGAVKVGGWDSPVSYAEMSTILPAELVNVNIVAVPQDAN